MSAARKASVGSLCIQQVRSGIGFNQKQNATLRALGLGRIGRKRSVPDNAQVRGMIGKIPHLVQIVNEEGNRKRQDQG